ncbi:MAG: type ISP restriction/modification enzyme, partial [Polynucleobacter sp.]|nr:type ISP restriction/modification enzyme [Polynucleobacter sp.]
MTATPRIFGSAAKKKAEEGAVVLCSMDDDALYGPEFHRLGFGEAVNENLLTDYKVLVLAVDERTGSAVFQKAVTTKDSELPVGDVSKIIGCWNGLSKKFVGDEAIVEDRNPMKRAVAFARSIEDSKTIAKFFQGVVKEYIANNPSEGEALDCEVHHVDGSFNVLKRNKELAWLKEDAPENTCRILTNARCLSEGVDVPALDAVLFLNARDSMVDVVQSIGRIMRRAEGKKYGYVILPITIPSGMAPEVALKDNERYKVVWKVLQALRAHDDRLDAEINQIELNKKKSKKIIIGVGGNGNDDEGGSGKKKDDEGEQLSLDLSAIEQWKDAIYARIVLKCGSRPYWENWASDVAKIAERHTDHIKGLLKAPDSKPRKAFDKFLQGIRKNINPSISETEAIEMLSQHLITKPVFDALFEHYPFADKNPVSRSMQSVLKVLESGSFKEDAEKLKSFYDSVRMRVKGIDTPEGRQKVIVELYDRFFKVAFPKMSDRLGIVYTPVEVVDFIINSVELVLKEEFGKSLSDKDVHILDPFTGTGTFIVRLLQSGTIKSEDLKRKFTKELHANEIVLLAYYIAAINIEETYHGLTGGDYTPFDGIVLTDTFQLNEEEAQGSFESALPENSERVERQKKAPIQIIIGNPPYSSGQRDGNDNNQNLDYPVLDKRIAGTYAKESSATLQNSLYDSYIRGIRWASDRIGPNGIIGFVTNGSFIDGNAADGLRKSMGKEFAKLYCFNLRGNQRTSGELSRREGGKIFGSGSRTPVAITILIKDPNHTGDCKILYHDIGDYLSREEKLSIIKNFGNINSIQWQQVKPNDSGDWISQRNETFGTFLNLGDKESSKYCLFDIHSAGVKTNRDAWAYSFGFDALKSNMSNMIANFNTEVKKYQAVAKSKSSGNLPNPQDFVRADDKYVKWTRELFADVQKGRTGEFQDNHLSVSLYRPYTKSWLYFNRQFNNTVYQIP